MRALLLALLLVAPALAGAREPDAPPRGQAQVADLAAFELDLYAVRESRARASTVVTESALGSVHRGEVARVLRHEAEAMRGLGFAMALLDPGPDAREGRDAAIQATGTFAEAFGLLLACSRTGDAAVCSAADARVAEAQAQLRDVVTLLRAGSGFS